MTAPDLVLAVAPLVEAATANFPQWLSTFARVSALAFFAPGIGERAVPTPVKIAVVLAISMLLAPLAPPIDSPASPASLFVLIAAEAANGLLLGFALRSAIFVLQICGAVIAQHLSLSQLVGTGVGFDQESPFATILIMGGLAAAAAQGIHVHLIAAMAQSYAMLPVGTFPGGEAAGAWSAMRAAEAFAAALGLSLPFVALGFAYAIALGAASRAMPQLPAAFVGAPAITLAGLALFAASAGVIIGRWLDAYRGLIAEMAGGAP